MLDQPINEATPLLVDSAKIEKELRYKTMGLGVALMSVTAVVAVVVRITEELDWRPSNKDTLLLFSLSVMLVSQCGVFMIILHEFSNLDSTVKLYLHFPQNLLYVFTGSVIAGGALGLLAMEYTARSGLLIGSASAICPLVLHSIHSVPVAMRLSSWKQGVSVHVRHLLAVATIIVVELPTAHGDPRQQVCFLMLGVHLLVSLVEVLEPPKFADFGPSQLAFMVDHYAFGSHIMHLDFVIIALCSISIFGFEL